MLGPTIISVAIFTLIICTFMKWSIKKEGFSSMEKYNRILMPGDYPLSADEPLLHGVFPTTGAKGVSNYGSATLWQYKPVVEVGSFDQITNNMKNIANPDDGSCAPGNMCGALYKDRKVPSNITQPLQPTPFGSGARVGFYRNSDYLLQFNNHGNMLY
jgi:hypothetical protein